MGLFIGATLGVIIPIYVGALINIGMFVYEFGGDIKRYFLYKKVKIDFEFDTEINLLNIASPQKPT